MHKLIRYLYYILFFATPFLMFSGTSELFEFNKMIFIYIITLCVITVWVISVIVRPSRLVTSVYLLPFLLFLASQIIATCFSIDRQTSLLGYYGRFNGGLLSILSYLTLFYVFVNTFEKKHITTLLTISTLSSFLVILWGLPGKFGHDLSCLVFTQSFSNNCWTDQFHPSDRMFSTLGQPNWLGAYLSIHFFIGLYFLLREKKSRFLRGLTGGYVILTFVAILFTRSNSAIVATGFGFILFTGLTFFQSSFKNYKIYKTLAGVFLMMVLLIAITNPSIIQKLLRKKQPTVTVSPDKYTVAVVTDSWDIRKIVWKGAVALGQAHPLFGTGVETFAYAYNVERPIEHNLTSEWDYIYNKAHNEFLNYFATTGYLGLLSYVAMIAGVIFLLFRMSEKSLATALLCSYLSINITNFFGFSTTTINLFFYLIPAFALTSKVEGRQSKVATFNLLHDIKKTLALVVLLVVFFYGLDYLGRYYVADMQYATVDANVRKSDYQEAARTLTNVLNLHYEHVYEDKLSSILANLSFYASYQKEGELAQKLMTLSNQYNLHALQQSPQNQPYWKTQAKNNYLFYQSALDPRYLTKGEESLKSGTRYAPVDPHFPYTLSLYYALHADETKYPKTKQNYQNMSLAQVNKAIALKSNYEDAYYLKGQLLKKYDNKEEAKKVFEFIINSINPKNDEARRELENMLK